MKTKICRTGAKWYFRRNSLSSLEQTNISKLESGEQESIIEKSQNSIYNEFLVMFQIRTDLNYYLSSKLP